MNEFKPCPFCDLEKILEVVAQLAYDMRSEMTSVTRYVKHERANHPTLTDGQFLDRSNEYKKLALVAVDKILKRLNENADLREIENLYFVLRQRRRGGR